MLLVVGGGKVVIFGSGDIMLDEVGGMAVGGGDGVIMGGGERVVVGGCIGLVYGGFVCGGGRVFCGGLECGGGGGYFWCFGWGAGQFHQLRSPFFSKVDHLPLTTMGQTAGLQLVRILCFTTKEDNPC